MEDTTGPINSILNDSKESMDSSMQVQAHKAIFIPKDGGALNTDRTRKLEANILTNSSSKAELLGDSEHRVCGQDTGKYASQKSISIDIDGEPMKNSQLPSVNVLTGHQQKEYSTTYHTQISLNTHMWSSNQNDSHNQTILTYADHPIFKN